MDALAAVAELEGAAPITPQERVLIGNILKGHDRTAADVMVPRVDIVALDVDQPFPEVIKCMIEHGHSRVPVYRETLDDVIGLGVDKVQRHFQKVTATLDAWRDHMLPDANAKAVIYDAFVAGALDFPKRLAPTVHRLYFEPEHYEFSPRTF